MVARAVFRSCWGSARVWSRACAIARVFRDGLHMNLCIFTSSLCCTFLYTSIKIEEVRRNTSIVDGTLKFNMVEFLLLSILE